MTTECLCEQSTTTSNKILQKLVIYRRFQQTSEISMSLQYVQEKFLIRNLFLSRHFSSKETLGTWKKRPVCTFFNVHQQPSSELISRQWWWSKYLICGRQHKSYDNQCLTHCRGNDFWPEKWLEQLGPVTINPCTCRLLVSCNNGEKTWQSKTPR